MAICSNSIFNDEVGRSKSNKVPIIHFFDLNAIVSRPKKKERREKLVVRSVHDGAVGFQPQAVA